MVSRRLLVPVGALAGILVLVSLQYSTIVSGLLRARTSLSGRGTQTHFDLYELLPPALDTNPLFGRGLNTFSTYFEFLTGRDNWVRIVLIALLRRAGIVATLAFCIHGLRFNRWACADEGRAWPRRARWRGARQPLAWGSRLRAVRSQRTFLPHHADCTTSSCSCARGRGAVGSPADEDAELGASTTSTTAIHGALRGHATARGAENDWQPSATSSSPAGERVVDSLRSGAITHFSPLRPR